MSFAVRSCNVAVLWGHRKGIEAPLTVSVTCDGDCEEVPLRVTYED